MASIAKQATDVGYLGRAVPAEAAKDAKTQFEGGAVVSVDDILHNRQAHSEPDSEAAPYDPADRPRAAFDVSGAFDAEFDPAGLEDGLDGINDPFAGTSPYRSQGEVAGPAWSRADMERTLRQLCDTANRLHWKGALKLNTVDKHGERFVDVTKLRRPTADELKALKLAGEAWEPAHRAAHVRVWLRRLDRDAEIARRDAADYQRKLKLRQARVDEDRVAELRQMIKRHAQAARRHQQRLKDQQAYAAASEAINQLGAIFERAEFACRELREPPPVRPRELKALD